MRAAPCFALGTDPRYIARVQLGFRGSVWPAAGTDAQPRDRWPAPAGSGRTLTFSFPPDGLSLPGLSGSAGAPNVLNQTMTARFGSATAWRQFMRGMFGLWSAVTDLQFTEVGDDGAAWGAGGSNARGDIRIGARGLDGPDNTLAFNYYPSSGGDMVIDAADLPGGSTSFWLNVIAHEIGHGIGLAHVCPATGTKLMEPTAMFTGTGPLVDDARGAQELYGDRLEPNDLQGAAISLASLGLSPVQPLVLRPLGLQTAADEDWFSIETCPQDSVTIRVTPIGTVYAQGPQTTACNTGTNVNAATIEDLALEFVWSTGLRTIINSSPAGGSETYTITGATGRTSLRVMSRGSSGERVQLYELRATIVRINSAVIYVNAAASGNGTGTSWPNAFVTLGQGLAAAQGGCGGTSQIWVAAGTYRPMTPLPNQLPDLTVSFVVPDGVQVYGGFAGNEIDLSQRDPIANVTTLSGSYPHPIITVLLANHVVRMTSVGPTTVLDGFRVVGGAAPTASPYGGGVWLQDASPTLRRCSVDSWAAGNGGGVASLGSGRPIFEDCTLSGGAPPPRLSATPSGGALFLSNGAQIARCRFEWAQAGSGAAIHHTGGLLEITDSVFEDNDATVRGGSSGQGVGGGALHAAGGTARVLTSTFRRNRGIDGGAIFAVGAVLDVERCRFDGNQATGAGGGLFGDGGTCRVAGSEFFANSADVGGGVALRNGAPRVLLSTLVRNDARTRVGGLHVQGTAADLVGTILWANTVALVGSGEAAQLDTNGGSFAVDQSCVEGWSGRFGGTGNFGTDPLLIDTLRGDLHLAGSSPCLDVGPGTASSLPTLDIDGQPRLLCARIDVGADEFGEATARIFGTTCAGDIDIEAPPRVAQTYEVKGWAPNGAGTLYLGLSDTLWSGLIPLPFDLTPLGPVGCLVWVSPDIEVYRGLVSSSPLSPTAVPVAVPNNASLVCAQLFHQWHFWQLGQPLSAYHTSRAVEVRVGY